MHQCRSARSCTRFRHSSRPGSHFHIGTLHSHLCPRTLRIGAQCRFAISFFAVFVFSCFFLHQANEVDAIAAWKSLRACQDLSVASLSDPTRCVSIPWPPIFHPQGDRMRVRKPSGTLQVDGREFLATSIGTRSPIARRRVSMSSAQTASACLTAWRRWSPSC